MVPTLLIVDAMNLIRRIYAVQEKQHGETDRAVLNTQNSACNALKKLLNLHHPTHAICVFDNHAQSWRHQLYADYKLGRKPISPLLKKGLTEIQDHFFKLGVDSLVTEDDEADDLIATLADKMSQQQKRTLIISTDKGFYQLLNPQTIIYDYFHNNYTDALRVKNKMQLLTPQLCDYWAITGCAGSAIKGVEGVGPKGALALLQEFDTLDNILLQPVNNKNKRLIKVLKDKDSALLARQLVTLRKDISLGFNLRDLRYSTS